MINRVVLVGRLTKDVEVRKTQTGLSVASFTVACDRRTSRSQDGNQQSADFLGQYARKGALVGVEGRIQTRSYDRQDGTKQYVTEVLCDNVNLLESKAQSTARAAQVDNGYNNFNNYQQPSYQPQPSAPAVQDDFTSGDTLDISNDDLPF